MLFRSPYLSLLSNRSEEKRNLLPQLVTIGEAHGPNTSGIPHQLLCVGVPPFMGLLVSEASLKEAGEGRNAVEVDMVKLTVSGDGVSPHQIPHTEIVEGFVSREVGTGMFKDTLRGGIWSSAVSGVTPGTGSPPPDLGIGVNVTRRGSTIITPRDMRIVALILLSIGFGGVVGHVGDCW